MILATLLAMALHCPDWSERIYLATYPRSGNHWMRYLIEEATHVATGSVYRDGDPQHQKKPFPWGAYCCKGGYEGMCDYPKEGEPFVVKTHYPANTKRKFDELPYKMALRIIRHPVPAIYSEYLFMMKFEKKKGEDIVPHEWVVKAVGDWKRFQTYWNDKPNVTTIIYEDLFAKPEAELKKALGAIGLKCSEEDIHRAVEKHPPATGVADHNAHFTKEDLAYIQNELKDLIAQFYP